MDKEYIICYNYPKCLCGFCHDCLRDKFGEDPNTLAKDWSCLVCHKMCKCERCIEKLEKGQKEIAAKDMRKGSKKEDKKTVTLKTNQVEEEKKEKPSKAQKPTQSKTDDEELSKRGRKRKSPEITNNTINEKQQEKIQEQNTTRKPKTKNDTKEQKKTKKEENNIVKIPMKQQSIPSLTTLQPSYFQHTDLGNQQMPYLLMTQQLPLANPRYSPSQNFKNNPFVPAPMTEQGVWNEQQEGTNKGRKRDKINKEK